MQAASWEPLPGAGRTTWNSRIGIVGRMVSVGWLRASRRRRPAELAWPGWVRRWACMNEFEGRPAGEAAAEYAATSAPGSICVRSRASLRMPGEKALRASGTRSRT